MAKDAKDEKIEPDGDAEPKKSKKKLLIMGVVVLLLVGGAYFFLLGGKGGGAAAAEKPVPGAVIKLDPVNINLESGHYLKLGLALQATMKAHEAPEGSKALDIAIAEFSNRPMAELGTDEGRLAAKHELIEKIVEAYEHDVMDVYFTEFVMQ